MIRCEYCTQPEEELLKLDKELLEMKELILKGDKRYKHINPGHLQDGRREGELATR